MQSQATNSLAIVVVVSATAGSGEKPPRRFGAPCSLATLRPGKTIPWSWAIGILLSCFRGFRERKTLTRWGHAIFVSTNRSIFGCDFCFNYLPWKPELTRFDERRSNRSFASARQELANFGRRRSRRHVESIGPPARSFRSRDFLGRWCAERAGDCRVEGVRCCLKRHRPARRERL